MRNSIFIVDDDADDRESIRDAFMENKHQYDYIFMKSGSELLSHLETFTLPDNSVILLDLNMPGIGGKDVLKVLKYDEKFKPIPVIVLTTSSSDTDRETSYALGANCFITKPHSYRELCNVTNYIAKLWCSTDMAKTLN